MTDICTQFHALPEEVTAFAKLCMEDFDLYAVAMKFFPFEATEVSAEELGKITEASLPHGDLALTLTKPKLPVKDQLDFYNKNPGHLHISLPTKDPEGLRQVALSTRTDNPELLSIWKKVNRRLKGMTRAGAFVMNPDTGARGWQRTFRYTEGAKAMASTGVPMLPVAGWNLVLFPDS
jgi:hypothetical protein